MMIKIIVTNNCNGGKGFVWTGSSAGDDDI